MKNKTFQHYFATPPNTYTTGTFSLVTYNIAGLPDFISKSNPSHNTKIISPLLNEFDIVLLQEDFFYHEEILKSSKHPYNSKKSYKGLFLTGDGLNRLSKFPFKNYYRREWNKRYGIISNDSDVLAPKGFSFAQHEIFPGVFIDIYNLHMDAGNSEGDFKARNNEMEQLIEELSKHSIKNTVIIAGDWNIKRKRPEDARILDKLITGMAFNDARIVLKVERDRIDKVLFKNGETVRLTPIKYKEEDKKFIDEKGKPLSDHIPIAVIFKWEYFPK